jgi:hypothetical protein
MLASAIPAKLSIPFANSGTKNTIPTASQIGVTPGAASLTDGFPPLTMTAVAAGGVPPFGQDMNGILYAMSAWQQWQGAGGQVAYDISFSTSIGGYPKGAVLTSTTAGMFWVSTADNNTTNPDSGGSNWLPMNAPAIQAQSGNYGADSGTANAMAVTLTPVPASLAALTGTPIRIKKIASANSGAVTLNVNGLGAAAVTWPDGTALIAGELPASGIVQLVCTGTAFVLAAPVLRPVMSGDTTQSMATFGWVKFPNGLIKQWTLISVGASGTTWTYPRSFPNNIYSVLATLTAGSASTNDVVWAVSPNTTSVFLDFNSTNSFYVYAEAWGN